VRKTSPEIFLVANEIWERGYCTLPFGIMYVGKALTNAGFKVRIFHLHSGEEKQFYKEVERSQPLFVGFSTIIGNALKRDIEMSKALKKMGQTIVWGGVFASMVPEQVLAQDYVDYVVIGEGEEITPQLAEAILEKEPPSSIPDVGWKDKGEIKINPPGRWSNNLDQYEPGWELIDLKKYLRKFPGREEYYWQISCFRGCPHKCSFCYNWIDSRRRVWRANSLEWCKEQLKYLEKRLPVKIKILSFPGDNSFGNKDHAWEIIYGLEKAWAGMGRLEIVDEDFVKKAKETQAVYLGFGLESASEKMLKIYQKELTPQKAMTSISLLSKLSCLVDVGMMFFGPGEEQADRRESILFMEKALKENPKVYFAFNTFWAFPKTPLWKKCLELGYHPPQTPEEWSERFMSFLEVYGWNRKKWLRANFLLNAFFGIPPRLAEQIPGWLRKILYQRLWKFEFNFPLEDLIRLTIKAWRAFR